MRESADDIRTTQADEDERLPLNGAVRKLQEIARELNGEGPDSPKKDLDTAAALAAAAGRSPAAARAAAARAAAAHAARPAGTCPAGTCPAGT